MRVATRAHQHGNLAQAAHRRLGGREGVCCPTGMTAHYGLRTGLEDCRGQVGACHCLSTQQSIKRKQACEYEKVGIPYHIGPTNRGVFVARATGFRPLAKVAPCTLPRIAVSASVRGGGMHGLARAARPRHCVVAGPTRCSVWKCYNVVLLTKLPGGGVHVGFVIGGKVHRVYVLHLPCELHHKCHIKVALGFDDLHLQRGHGTSHVT